ncbi:MAG TPA: D-alanyl-D-alanine carboxypeptidase/D-alanyl-D-alanine-endopeptidase [Kofleriaceae bacterium]|nr:D-alanyl-D-alanine carboxypeptidase/D-alanyl-D-alanine-endopeptidase [Kofleriaceae bacterium]
MHPARSQGSGSGSGDPGDVADPAEDDGTTAGAGSALVAPKEPKARAQWLVDRLAATVSSRPALATARIGYQFVDLRTNALLSARDGDKPFNLASNVKILTGAAALAGLGGGFRWRTAVYGETEPDDTGTIAGDLYVRGRGDPTLSVAALQQLAHDVAARGVRNIEGKLVLDAGYFDKDVEPPHFTEQPKERAAFRAPVASFGVNRSAVTLTVMPEPGGAARVTLDPKTEYYVLAKAEVTSVVEGRTRLKVEQKQKKDHVELEVTGQIKIGEGSWDLRRRVDDPARFAAEVFERALEREGIKIRKPQLATGTVPLTAKLLAHHDSPPLLDVVRAMNKYSDNYVAESILKTLGAELKGTAGPATWADGLAAVRTQLAKLGLATGSYRVGNGSGLYAASEVTPKQLVTLLAAAHRDYRIGPDLLASLPVGGLDGTLARRWHGKAAAGRVRAKTGTLDKVITLAGYVALDPDRVVAFAILVNDVAAKDRKLARAAMDEMIDVIVAYLAPQ